MTEKRITPQQLTELYQDQRKRFQAFLTNENNVKKNLFELKGTFESLKELKKSDDDQILVNFGSGVYVDAVVKDKFSVKGNIGGGAVKTLKMDVLIKKIEKRIKVLEKNLNDMLKQEVDFRKQLMSLENALLAVENARKNQLKRNEKSTPTIS